MTAFMTVVTGLLWLAALGLACGLGLALYLSWRYGPDCLVDKGRQSKPPARWLKEHMG